uniref:SCP domain-containing protein n=1 Tax=viral metagenome TaxID=1070528 RepID=A0A6C0BDY4_9ZZZZ
MNISVIVNYVSMYRAMYCVPSVNICQSAMIFAKDWADHLVKNNVFQHSPFMTFGENIAMHLVPVNYNETYYTLKSIDMWMSESPKYNFSRPGYSDTTGHFTALVWKSTKCIGFAAARSSSGKLMVVMKFYPPGNGNVKMFQSSVLHPSSCTTSSPPKHRILKLFNNLN